MKGFQKHKYRRLLDQSYTSDNETLLFSLVTHWGRSKQPPQNMVVQAYTPNYQHTLTTCSRTDPTPTILPTDAELLLDIFQLYGPVFVHPERVAQACTGLVTSHLRHCVKLHVDYATRATTLVSLSDVYTKVRASNPETCTYYPEWNHVTQTVPFLSKINFDTAFSKLTAGCLDDFPWDGVVAVGEAVAACVVKGRYTAHANHALETVVVDLYAFTSHALLRTTTFFNEKYMGNVFWGLGENNTVIVCVREVPRVFRIFFGQHTNEEEVVTSFDLDFCQLCYSRLTGVFMTPVCIRSHATRVCVVSPYVLPNRQSLALDNGFGLMVYGKNSLPGRTFWDNPRSYTPLHDHTDSQVRYNMHLNLGCSAVSRDPVDVVDAVTRNAVPDVWYTGEAFLVCDHTMDSMFSTLTHALPTEGVVGYVLPMQLRFHKSLWMFMPEFNSIILKDDATKYMAPGRHGLVAFVKRMQLLFNVCYGEDQCVCPVEVANTLHIEYMPNSRVVDTQLHQLVSLETIQATKRKYAVCTEMHCTTILVGPTWWSPVFTCLHMDLFPLDLIHHTE